MITELIRDNRKIIDRIPKEDIDRIIELVKKFKVIKALLQHNLHKFLALNNGYPCLGEINLRIAVEFF